MFRREEVLAVYEDGWAAGKAGALVRDGRYWDDLDRKPLLRDHLFEDA